MSEVKHSEKITKCDFCGSPNGILKTINRRNCQQIIAICHKCQKAKAQEKELTTDPKLDHHVNSV